MEAFFCLFGAIFHVNAAVKVYVADVCANWFALCSNELSFKREVPFVK